MDQGGGGSDFLIEYDKGVRTITPPIGSPVSQDYFENTAEDWYGHGGTSSPNEPGDPLPWIIDCSGEIEVKITWTGEGTPPDKIVLQETSEACAHGDGPTADNGLDHPELPDGNGVCSSGTKYDIIDLPDSGVYEYTRNPSASASTTVALSADAHVHYMVEVCALDIAFTGTENTSGDPGVSLLIGQKLTADIDCKPPAHAADSYSWTVDMGQPFADYITTEPLGDVIDVAVPITSSNASFYFSNPVTVTLSCTYTSGLVGKTVTVSRQLAVLSPQVDVKEIIGTIQIRPSGPILQLFGGNYVHFDGSSYFRGVTPGVVFGGRVSTPTIFHDGLNTGSWTYVQTIVPNRFYYDGSGLHTICQAGSEVKDGVYPYGFITMPGFDENYRPADWLERNTEDSPSTGLPGKLVAAIGHWEEFSMHVYYIPPGTDSRPVSLRAWKWNWAGTATLTGTNQYDSTHWELTLKDQRLDAPLNFLKQLEWTDTVDPSCYVP